MSEPTPLIDEANNRYTQAKGYWSPFFARCAEEKNFLHGDQWRPDLRQQRESDGRPVMQLPRIQNFVRQLHAQNRQSKPNIIVSANDSSSKEDADIVNGIIRKIEAQCSADIAYDHASESAIKIGIGALRIYTDYSYPTSFDQDIKIEAIYDESAVLFDPAARDPLFEDSEYVFIESVMRRDQYARQIGESTKLSNLAKIVGFTSSSPLAVDEEHIVILEYYRKVHKSTTIYKYSNIITGENVITNEKSDDTNLVLVNSRTSSTCKIMHSLFDGLEFHNTTELPGTIIPVIPVLGEMQYINKVRQLKGVIRDSMDVQRVINYTASVQLEVVDLAPKVPWLVEEGTIDGYETEWRDANMRNYSYLVYKNKNGAPPPTRMPIATDITSIANIKNQSQDDMQAIFGIFDAALGDAGPEQSGVAIQTRINQTNQSTYIYKDNMMRSIRQTGRVIADMIPEYYNGRQIVIPNIDGSDKKVQVDLDPLASFEISIKSGPTNESARQSLNADLMQLVTAMPQVAPLVSDYIIKNSDLPGTEKLVARLQTLLPPEIRQIESGDAENMSPDEMNSKMMQGVQENAALNAHSQEVEQQNAQLQQELEALKVDKSFEQQKLMMEMELKKQQLQLDATKLQLDFELASETLRLQAAKLAVETTTGMETDAIQSPNL